MSKSVKQLQSLIKSDIRKAHEYFAANKTILFRKANVALHGEELLTAFHQLQCGYIKKPAGLDDYKKAINFYYENCEALKSINIMCEPNFSKYKLIIFYNQDLENSFHASLSAALKKTTAQSISKEEIQKWLDNISFAQGLLKKSIAKLDKKPNETYNKFKSQLEVELNKDKAVTLAAKPAAAAAPNDCAENPFLFFALHAGERLQAGEVLPKKPTPPQDAVAPRVLPLFCIKSSAQTSKKRSAPDAPVAEKKAARASNESDNRPTFQA